jgi:hypothetical protein
VPAAALPGASTARSTSGGGPPYSLEGTILVTKLRRGLQATVLLTQAGFIDGPRMAVTFQSQSEPRLHDANALELLSAITHAFFLEVR